jgi:hypothetical protein
MEIQTTGQRARVSQSIIAGQPRAIYEVDVVEIDGDTLTYTTAANPSWRQTARRTQYIDWEIVGEAPVAAQPLPRPAAETALLHVLRYVVDSAELVDSYCVDYTEPGGTGTGPIDLRYLASEKIDHVRRTLAELDAVIQRGQTGIVGDPIARDIQVTTVRRAASLASAIREALGRAL